MLKRLLFVVLLAFASVAHAQTYYSLPWGPKPQFVDANGAPMSSGTLSFYVAGSSTPQNTYTTATSGVANSNPITLNSRGETPNEVWLTGGASYKLILKDSAGATVWTVDNITGVNDVTSQLGLEWVASGLTPTFISATSFSLAGDQTTVFHVGRRLKTTNSGGTIYSTITASAFGSATTITVENDTGTLDSGLSSVSYGVISQANSSQPALTDQGPVVVNYSSRTKRVRISAANVTAGQTRVLTMQDANISVGNIAGPARGRCTLTSATPITTGDVTAATTVYFTPYKGNTIQLYDGTDWNTHVFTELSQATTDTTKSPAAVTTNTNYDVFVWNDAGTLRATRGPAWSSATARGTGAGTTELEVVGGRYVNKVAITNGPAAQRGHYVCTIRSDGSSQINDSAAFRHVWNNYNRVPRPMRVLESTDSWTYTTATFRQANANTANQLDYVVGLSEDPVYADVYAAAANTNAEISIRVGIGIDSTSVNSASRTSFGVTSGTNTGGQAFASYEGFPGIGRHTLVWLEFSVASGTTTWYGDNGAGTVVQNGIAGRVLQ